MSLRANTVQEFAPSAGTIPTIHGTAGIRTQKSLAVRIPTNTTTYQVEGATASDEGQRRRHLQGLRPGVRQVEFLAKEILGWINDAEQEGTAIHVGVLLRRNDWVNRYSEELGARGVPIAVRRRNGDAGGRSVVDDGESVKVDAMTMYSAKGMEFHPRGASRVERGFDAADFRVHRYGRGRAGGRDAA